jgi:hypothetical protein
MSHFMKTSVLPVGGLDFSGVVSGMLVGTCSYFLTNASAVATWPLADDDDDVAALLVLAPLLAEDEELEELHAASSTAVVASAPTTMVRRVDLPVRIEPPREVATVD